MMRRKKNFPRTFWIAIIGLLAPSLSYPENVKTLYVGIGEHIKSFEGDKRIQQVRVLFKKTKIGWESMPGNANTPEKLKNFHNKFPDKLDWTICFDGKKIGQVSSINEPYRYYGEIGRQKLTKNSKLPMIGKETMEFAGWPPASYVYRPVVLATIPNCGDPERWRPGKLQSKKLKQALAHLEKVMEKRRKFIEKSPITHGIDEDMWPYDIKASKAKVRKAYQSKPGHQFAQILTGDEKAGGLESFFFLAKGNLIYVGPSYTLVDAGDYDRDGKTEVILKKTHYNNDGYVLYHGDFTKPVEFDWSYH